MSPRISRLPVLGLVAAGACAHAAPVKEVGAGFAQLKAAFDAQANRPRVVLLVSPT